MNWIKTADEKPPKGHYVLIRSPHGGLDTARFTRGKWHSEGWAMDLPAATYPHWIDFKDVPGPE